MFQFRPFPSYAYLFQRRITRYCRVGFPHSEIHGYNGYLLLPVAYRSLSRPSSAPDAKAFPLRSFQLDLTPCAARRSWFSRIMQATYYGRIFFREIVSLTFRCLPQCKTKTLLCRLAFTLSLFSFQGTTPASFETRLKHSIP